MNESCDRDVGLVYIDRGWRARMSAVTDRLSFACFFSLFPFFFSLFVSCKAM